MPQQETYTTPDVAAALQLDQRTLLHWATEGLVRPTPERSGKRPPLLWSERDVWETRIVRELLRGYGMNMPSVLRIMEEIRRKAQAGAELRVELVLPDVGPVVAESVTMVRPRDLAQTDLQLIEAEERPRRRA